MVRVSVTEGLLEGEIVQNEYGGTFYSFKGIPYAQPPVGELRFKAPLPLEPWTGIRQAKQFGPVCTQFNFMNPNLNNMSEDCLYINVYTPDTKPSTPIPVMVWIHGGGFVWGSGDDDLYGPQFLIRHGVVLVTFNYRLEALGFLCLDSPDMPGNAGMKDQVQALRWVKKNISSFGGDPDNITIFGESAGASSVSYHLISNMSKGLFRRAIAQSGAATCRWAQDICPREKALLLARQLGCHAQDDKELYEFFKQQPVEALVGLTLLISKSQKSYELHFAITNEKDFGQERFFYGDVVDALRNNVHEGIEIMTGYTQDEGLMALAIGTSLDKMVIEANYYSEFFVPQFLKVHCTIRDQLDAGRKLRQLYTKGGVISEDGVIKFLSTDMFVYDTMFAGQIYSQNNKVYLYKFTAISERNFMGHCFGLTEVIGDRSVVCHADDLAYLFPIKMVKGKVEETSKAFKLIDTVTSLWTNFAKYGNPTASKNLDVEWKPFTLEDKHYMEIGNELRMGTAPDKEELEFWESVINKYLPTHTV